MNSLQDPRAANGRTKVDKVYEGAYKKVKYTIRRSHIIFTENSLGAGQYQR